MYRQKTLPSSVYSTAAVPVVEQQFASLGFVSPSAVGSVARTAGGKSSTKKSNKKNNGNEGTIILVGDVVGAAAGEPGSRGQKPKLTKEERRARKAHQEEMYWEHKRKEKKLEIERQRNEERELAECTFQPCTNVNSNLLLSADAVVEMKERTTTESQLQSKFDELHDSARVYAARKQHLELLKQQQEEEALKECTFTPQINPAKVKLPKSDTENPYKSPRPGIPLHAIKVQTQRRIRKAQGITASSRPPSSSLTSNAAQIKGFSSYVLKLEKERQLKADLTTKKGQHKYHEAYRLELLEKQRRLEERKKQHSPVGPTIGPITGPVTQQYNNSAWKKKQAQQQQLQQSAAIHFQKSAVIVKPVKVGKKSVVRGRKGEEEREGGRREEEEEEEDGEDGREIAAAHAVHRVSPAPSLPLDQYSQRSYTPAVEPPYALYNSQSFESLSQQQQLHEQRQLQLEQEQQQQRLRDQEELVRVKAQHALLLEQQQRLVLQEKQQQEQHAKQQQDLHAVKSRSLLRQAMLGIHQEGEGQQLLSSDAMEQQPQEQAGERRRGGKEGESVSSLVDGLEEPLDDGATVDALPSQQRQQQRPPASSATQSKPNVGKVVLFVDVQLTPERSVRIAVRVNDDIRVLASDFARDHQLDATYVPVLARMLQEQLHAAQMRRLERKRQEQSVKEGGWVDNNL